MKTLEMLFPRVRAGVFRVLFNGAGAEVHLRQLARLCGVAIGTLQDELSVLEKTGLVRTRREGNRLLLRAQQAHPLFPSIQQFILQTTPSRSHPKLKHPSKSRNPSAPVTVRNAVPSDRMSWLRMRRKLWPGHRGHARETRAYFSQPRTDAVVLIAAMKDGSTAGFLELGLRSYAEGCTSSPVAYIEGWWVEEKHRRKGVGHALVLGAEAWSRDRGLMELASDCAPENHASASAHKACGFIQSGRILCFKKGLAPKVGGPSLN
ncbi:MAG: GNAT family N-acetyltransferase [Candidatus Methylacidiphilales bacterium]|nr:GNAT family N-acetyltransferase [Candidatus Methylacidiphilales bacterium]